MKVSPAAFFLKETFKRVHFNMYYMEILTLILIFVVAMITSAFGTLIGGSSLITIPLLIFIGIPPATAIGTNRAGLIGLAIAGWYEFDKKHLINYKIGWPIGIAALIGSIIGAKIVLQINENFLKIIIAILTIAILIFMIIEKDIGIKKTKTIIKTKNYVIGTIIGFGLGIYGGFYGAGFGTFLSYLLILVFGESFIERAATRKIAGFLIAVAATIVFAINGKIIYSLALVLFIGDAIGSYLGSKYSEKIGNVWIKRAFIGIVILMVLTLLF